MLVANNTFDLWQKDSFFSAAEEVQESTDILESAYRAWLKVQREVKAPVVVEELHRELQTALGTAKWQLEEFEKSVRLSHGTCRDENRTARHLEFVLAMENQISHIENALRETLHEDGKQQIRWVNLDDEERDDLAMFISGVPVNLQSRNVENIKTSVSSERKDLLMKNDSDYCLSVKYGDREIKSHSWSRSSKDEITITMDSSCYITEVSSREVPGAKDELSCPGLRTINTRRTWTTPNFGSLQIEIPDENRSMRALETCTEATPKLKGSRMMNLMQDRVVDWNNWINQISRCYSFFRRKMQSTRPLPFGQAIWFIITLIAILCLFVLYISHST